MKTTKKQTDFTQNIQAVEGFIITALFVIFVTVMVYPRIVNYLDKSTAPAVVDSVVTEEATPTAVPETTEMTVREMITITEQPAQVIEILPIVPTIQPTNTAVSATKEPTQTYEEQHPIVTRSFADCQNAANNGRRSNPSCASAYTTITPAGDGR